MPFITEEIYASLPHTEESIMIAEYPVADDTLCFADAAADMERVIAAIRAIRARRNEMNVVPSRKAKIYIATKYQDSFAPATEAFFKRLASGSELAVAATVEAFDFNAEDAVQIVTDAATILLPMSDLVDTEKERARLCAEVARLENEIKRAEAKLSNEAFVAKAPAAVVEIERGKLEKYRENLEGVKAALAKLH
jgi:valyl-tRNA synthetase